MIRGLTSVATTAVVAVFLTASAMAATVIDKKSCMQAVADAKEAASTAAVGTKAKAEIADLIRISEHLWGEANFVYAETLLAIARGMAAQE